MPFGPGQVNLPVHDVSGRGLTPGSSIVIATIMRPSGFTGVQTHTRSLHEGLVRRGVVCSVSSPFSSGKKWWPLLAVRPLLLRQLNRNWSTRWHRYWHYLALRDDLRAHCAKNRVAVVIAQDPLSGLAALDVRDQLRQRYLVALVCRMNVSEADELREQGQLGDRQIAQRIVQLEDRVIESADLVVHNSFWQKRNLEETRGLRPKSSVVIWHGIAERTQASPLKRVDLGLEPDDIVLINVGSFEPRKNQLALLDLFEAVSTRHPRARLLLVGSPGPYLHLVRRRIEALGLSGKVRILVERRDVPSLLATSDIYVHYAAVESFGFVLIEAARAGLPLAAVPVGAIPEVMSALGGGVALDPNDRAASLQRLRPLMESRQLRVEKGRLAQENFKKQFTQDRMARDYLLALGLLGGPDDPADEVEPASPIAGDG